MSLIDENTFLSDIMLLLLFIFFVFRFLIIIMIINNQFFANAIRMEMMEHIDELMCTLNYHILHIP